MTKVNILIVEDEAIIADNIFFTLKEMGYNPLKPCKNYDKAVEMLDSDLVDVAILDIELGKGKNGVELAEYINENHPVPFIFLTANHDVATFNTAKRVDPYAFLAKPFNKRELFSAIELAIHNFSKSKSQEVNPNNYVINDSLFIKEDKIFNRIPFTDINYLRSERMYTEIFTDEKKHVVRGSLNSLIDKLGKQFFRCHRSYIINLDKLKGVNHTCVFVTDQEIPLGKIYRDELHAKLQKI